MTTTNPNRRTFLKTTTGLGAIAISPSLSAEVLRPLAAPLSVGLIGAGRHGRSILTELQKIEGLTISAICDIDPRRLENAVGRTRGAATAYPTHAELLDKGNVDAVIVATPTHMHRQPAIDSLQAGKHVFCEGPLAHSVEDCRALAQAANTSDRIFQVGMYGRSNPIYKLARTFVLSGSIRDYISCRAQKHVKTSWRTPGGNPARDRLVNWRLDPEVSLGLAGEFGTQQFDVFNWYRRKYPIKVHGNGTIRLHKDGREVADTINCMFTWSDDVVLNYEATLGNSYEDEHELMFGTMGTVKLIWTHGWLFKEADAPTQGWEVYANRQQFHGEEGITLIANATQLADQGKLKEGIGLEHGSLFYALEDFARSIDEEQPSRCTATEGLKAAVVAMAANKAVVNGTTVEIDHGLFEV